jgi:hypothetical protein
MPLSMSQASVPVFTRMLTNLAAILTKAEVHAGVKRIDPSVFISARLAPDMLPLTSQIQIACDSAKGAAARLAGVEIPSFPDTETTFPELQARIAKTLDFIKSVPAAQIDGSEEKVIKLKIRGREVEFKGQFFLQHFAMANFYFHITTAYDILRHNGVEIGKQDFLGAV